MKERQPKGHEEQGETRKNGEETRSCKKEMLKEERENVRHTTTA